MDIRSRILIPLAFKHSASAHFHVYPATATQLDVLSVKSDFTSTLCQKTHKETNSLSLSVTSAGLITAYHVNRSLTVQFPRTGSMSNTRQPPTVMFAVHVQLIISYVRFSIYIQESLLVLLRA